jgi:hypothetical protein
MDKITKIRKEIINLVQLINLLVTVKISPLSNSKTKIQVINMLSFIDFYSTFKQINESRGTRTHIL